MKHLPRTWTAGLLTLLAAGLSLGGAVRAEEKLDAVLARVRKAAGAARSLKADLSMGIDFEAQRQSHTWKVSLLKPASGRMQLLGPDGRPVQTVVSDGKTVHIVLEEEKQFIRRAAGSAPEEALSAWGRLPVVAFFKPESLVEGGTAKYGGTHEVDGARYEVVEFTSREQPNMTGRAYIGATGLVEGVEYRSEVAGQPAVRSFWLRHIQLNPPLKAQEFAYRPPRGFTAYQPPRFDQELIPVGKEAPDFQLPQPGGGRLSLSDLRKGKKAVLVNFWFYN